MVCATCGTQVLAGVNFCARCGGGVIPATGQPIYAAQPEPVAGHYGVPYAARLRVARNLQALGILWAVFAAYRVVSALIESIFMHAFVRGGFGGPGWRFGHDFQNGWGQHPRWLAALLPVIFVVTAISVGLSIFVSWSLLNRKSWGRTLAIVAAVLALLKFPFGTALGIYTLWVMAPGAAGMEWEALRDRS